MRREGSIVEEADKELRRKAVTLMIQLFLLTGESFH